MGIVAFGRGTGRGRGRREIALVDNVRGIGGGALLLLHRPSTLQSRGGRMEAQGCMGGVESALLPNSSANLRVALRRQGQLPDLRQAWSNNAFQRTLEDSRR